MRLRYLSIAGETRSLVEWSMVKGAVNAETIRKRLWYGWTHIDAVFLPLGSKPSPIAPPKRVAMPAPHAANPLRPCVGFRRSYSIEHLEMLRRVA